MLPTHRKPPPPVTSSPTDEAERKHMEEALDEALNESFPASDPVAVSFPGAVAEKLDQYRATSKSRPKT